MNKALIPICFLIFGLKLTSSQNSNELVKLLASHKEEFGDVLEYPEEYNIQILYTQINRDQNNTPHFTSYQYNAKPKRYFYPASSIKIFAAALALEKINLLGIKDLNQDTFLAIDSSYSGQTAVKSDSTSKSLKPSIGHYIKKLFVVSDNDAFNRLYEFIGQKTFNETLQQKGYNLRMTHRLSISLSQDENKHTNGFTFYKEQPYQVVYHQNPANSVDNFTANQSIFMGDSYIKNGITVDTPMDFKEKNYASIYDLQKVIKAIMFPEYIAPQERFNLTTDDYHFLRQYMSQLPRETLYPNYSKLPDNYCKFFLYGNQNKVKIPRHIRIFNKIGNAYGFSIDNAYVVDLENNIEFLLTAVIYTNKNNTLNDGIYEYDTIGFPFLAKLGRLIYDYELKRDRKHQPNLDQFKLNYDIE